MTTTTPNKFIRANTTGRAAGTPKVSPQIAWSEAGLPKLAQLMFSLMLRNAASDGFLFVDPIHPDPKDPQSFSLPGCIIAAPSSPANTAGIDQDYVYNWTRDAAITAIEIAAANLPAAPGTGVQPLIDYVNFAQTCQNNATPSIALASYTIRGLSRQWTEQTDGPALQTLAILMAYSQLDTPTQAIAAAVISKNLDYLLAAYQNQTFNLWEEHLGFSFFARSVQLRCFQAIKANAIGIPIPPGIDAAISWLQTALPQHWNGTLYVSLVPAPPGYDANIDIISACLYGAVPCTDTKLLATAAQIRDQWEDPNSPDHYPINISDKNSQGIGPLSGRYPGDVYDGDVNDPTAGDHPWALCTCNFAELYYTLANQIQNTQTVPIDQFSSPFFSQIGVTSATPVANVVTNLQNAGDAMLAAVIYHSDHLELSEQFDGVTGYEKSVKNLTWSYAAFLSAVRARTGQDVQG
ncbi:MAG: glucoamylase [Verrucomicrobia bacterium]|nr:glucoamylase [Verrucomicrobiota bacterium]